MADVDWEARAAYFLEVLRQIEKALAERKTGMARVWVRRALDGAGDEP